MQPLLHDGHQIIRINESNLVLYDSLLLRSPSPRRPLSTNQVNTIQLRQIILILSILYIRVINVMKKEHLIKFNKKNKTKKNQSTRGERVASRGKGQGS